MPLFQMKEGREAQRQAKVVCLRFHTASIAEKASEVFEEVGIPFSLEKASSTLALRRPAGTKAKEFVDQLGRVLEVGLEKRNRVVGKPKIPTSHQEGKRETNLRVFPIHIELRCACDEKLREQMMLLQRTFILDHYDETPRVSYVDSKGRPVVASVEGAKVNHYILRASIKTPDSLLPEAEVSVCDSFEVRKKKIAKYLRSILGRNSGCDIRISEDRKTLEVPQPKKEAPLRQVKLKMPKPEREHIPRLQQIKFESLSPERQEEIRLAEARRVRKQLSQDIASWAKDGISQKPNLNKVLVRVVTTQNQEAYCLLFGGKKGAHQVIISRFTNVNVCTGRIEESHMRWNGQGQLPFSLLPIEERFAQEILREAERQKQMRLKRQGPVADKSGLTMYGVEKLREAFRRQGQGKVPAQNSPNADKPDSIAPQPSPKLFPSEDVQRRKQAPKKERAYTQNGIRFTLSCSSEEIRSAPREVIKNLFRY